MPNVVLGNESVIEQVKKDPDGDASPENLKTVKRGDLGNQVTTISVPPTHQVEVKGGATVTEWPLDHQLAAIRTFVQMHIGSGVPAWVESDDPLIEQMVAQTYGCPIGQPKGWKVG